MSGSRGLGKATPTVWAGSRRPPYKKGVHPVTQASTVRSIMQPATEPTTMDRHAHGQVHTEVVDDRILVMTVDRVEKKNAFTPKISNELAAAYTRLDDDPE